MDANSPNDVEMGMSNEQSRRGGSRCIYWQDNVRFYWERHAKVICTAIGLLFLAAYFVYFGFALDYRFGGENEWRLLVCTLVGCFLLVFSKLTSKYEGRVDQLTTRLKNAADSKHGTRFMVFFRWFLRVGVLVGLVVYVVLDIALTRPENLISVAGLGVYILVFYLTSVNPAKVNWHTVYWGIAVQYVFALVILRTTWGYRSFSWLGDRLTEFLNYATAGVVFVFGETYTDHLFAMKVLSLIAFIFPVINILYYIGAMQAVIRVLGRFLAFCMGTTPAESINAAANIFGSMIDSPLLIKPFLETMSRSELHAVMTGGFATIAGSVLGAYISLGVPANHLLSASVMSAPAALAIAKLSYPEEGPISASSRDFKNMLKSTTTDGSIIEAVTNGATFSIKIIGSIATNIIAFLSLLAFFNATLTWFGDRVGVENLTFEMICSYLLFPASFFMGVEVSDCRKVAELIGVKTFTNEFIAYRRLEVLITNRQYLDNYTTYYNTSDWYWQGGDVVVNMTGADLKGGVISDKSVIISTYALCGFANFGSIGITLGGLGALIPHRKPELAQMVMRAMICGNVACFLTACIAGLFYNPM